MYLLGVGAVLISVVPESIFRFSQFSLVSLNFPFPCGLHWTKMSSEKFQIWLVFVGSGVARGNTGNVLHSQDPPQGRPPKRYPLRNEILATPLVGTITALANLVRNYKIKVKFFPVFGFNSIFAVPWYFSVVRPGYIARMSIQVGP